MKLYNNPQFKKRFFRLSIIIALVVFFGLSFASEPAKRVLTFQDIMKFKEIHDPQISADGQQVTYNAQPDRGNGEVIVYNVASGQSHRIERGSKPALAKNGKWAAVLIKPDVLALENASEKEKKELKEALLLYDTTNNKEERIEKVKDFVFSDDSRWLVYRPYPEEEKEKKEDKKDNKDKKANKEKKKKNEWVKKAGPLVCRHLASREETRFENVLYFAFDPSSRYLAYSVYTGADDMSSLFAFDLQVRVPSPERETKTQTLLLIQDKGAIFNNLSWSKEDSQLAFLFHYDQENQEEKKSTAKAPVGKKDTKHRAGLWIFDGLKRRLTGAVLKENIPAGWMLPADNKFTWTKDGERLFLGLKPISEYEFFKDSDKEKDKKKKGDKKEKENITEKKYFSSEYLLKKKAVDVWHWQDPMINPQQKKRWERDKKRTYGAVYHVKKKRLIQLADQTMPRLVPTENAQYILGFSQIPYQRETTWDGFYQDVYVVNLHNGTRKQILTHYDHHVSLSPGGKFVIYYLNKQWYLYDTGKGTTRNLTGAMNNPFYDEDYDYPSPVPSYGIAGWLEKDLAVLVYDKYDIWQFSTANGRGYCLTGGKGRKESLSFRLIKTDAEQKFLKKDQELLLSAFSQKEKNTALYSYKLGGLVKGKPGTTLNQLLGGKKKYSFILKAKDAETYLYTRESFEEFPDLWITGAGFDPVKKISHVNPQIKNFWWGKARLIEWNSLDGIRLQGIAILPENYDPAKRYPVLVYYYRFFSQRLYDFNQMVVNHRPNFPYYTSNGYVMFLPDVRFRVGQPGYSATKCVVTGVQELIDMGIADPKAIALHGHSWSGYQTAFMVTQTDIFAAAIAGAPVANMTSAYSGIRWGSGMARQFQYEKSQSRIGASLWEAPQLYIENSPVFFADRIHTPLLIEHGDKDEAVPWYQSIELYLAMRRLNKPCVFLQYNDEPHHLKQYANKLDYSIKMKEFLDHYLKGKKAPQWLSEGIPFQKSSN